MIVFQLIVSCIFRFNFIELHKSNHYFLVFQQVPLNVIESNTELISFYRKKRDTENTAFKQGAIKGITSNSVDGLESLSPAALLALASMSQNPNVNLNTQDFNSKSDSFFGELAQKSLKVDESKHSRAKRYSYEPTNRINDIFAAYEQLASDNGRRKCNEFAESQRKLPGDVIYGVETQFESQSKLALSIAHFLSSFYQIINPEEDFPLRNAEKALSEDQLHAEVIASIAADFRAVGVGIFFDRNKFKKDKEYFGPYAFRVRDNLNVEIQKHYQMVDLTGFENGYINEEWFQAIKARWATSPDMAELEQFYLKPFIRGDYAGKILVHYESGFPQYFYGAKLK